MITITTGKGSERRAIAIFSSAPAALASAANERHGTAWLIANVDIVAAAASMVDADEYHITERRGIGFYRDGRFLDISLNRKGLVGWGRDRKRMVIRRAA